MEESTHGIQSQFCIGYSDLSGIRYLELLGIDEIEKFDAWPEIEYPEFFWWRIDHLVQPEPDDPMQYRCPRCFSTKIDVSYPYIQCLHCGYDEPLIDFPISHDFHLAFTKEFKVR